MSRRHVCAPLTIILALFALPAAIAQDAEKRVFVTVLDGEGTPIAGLTPDHFAVRESGKDRQVVNVQPLRIPMHVAVLVDTSAGNGAPDESFRSAVVGFVERLAAFNHVAVYSFGDRAASVVSFTRDAAQLRAKTVNMFGWSNQRSHLIDAVDLALRDLSQIETARPVIVAIASESPEASGRSAGGVIKRLISQSVAFHTVSLASATGTGQASGVNGSIPASSQRLGGMIATGEGDRERNRMLQQGTQSTGGGRQRLTSSLALDVALDRVARELSTSYLVTFSRSGSNKIKDLQVGVMLEGVTLRATAAPFGTR
jgi:VWFA-related protein